MFNQSVVLYNFQILATIFGLCYWQQKLDQKGITNINGVLFLMLTNMTFSFVFGVINVSLFLFFLQKLSK